MRHYKVDMRGKLWIHRTSTLPAWQAGDEGRLVYAEDVDLYYIGGPSDWILSLTDPLTSQDNTITVGSGTRRFTAIYAVDFEGIARQARYA